MQDIHVQLVDFEGFGDNLGSGGNKEFTDAINGTAEEFEIAVAAAKDDEFFTFDSADVEGFEIVDHGLDGMAFFTLPVPRGGAEENEFCLVNGVGSGVESVDHVYFVGVTEHVADDLGG